MDDPVDVAMCECEVGVRLFWGDDAEDGSVIGGVFLEDFAEMLGFGFCEGFGGDDLYLALD